MLVWEEAGRQLVDAKDEHLQEDWRGELLEVSNLQVDD